eukprot:11468500-Alexandrium_andersonii.AAC.1
MPSKELEPGLSPQVPALPGVFERSFGGKARSDGIDMRPGLMVELANQGPRAAAGADARTIWILRQR